ncbi:MAG TPA: NAD(+)/NADH kinase [Chloroflexota bacterium]|nr:NAD(+)/NADH kinase [Chloroflexota bacterium]
MSIVGIIANPASGRDIRRLVARASVFGNNEKVNILQRILLALDTLGVEEAVIMPDSFGLGLRALDGLDLPSLRASILEMPMAGTAEDSSRAAAMMRERGTGCIVVLGGDGTNRVVAKTSGGVPIVPVSTGTNNVFPSMVEGTVAGMAAGLVATGAVVPDDVTYRAKRLELYLGGQLSDIALIDVVTSSDLWVGTRAIWDPARVGEIVLAQAEPGSIGISSVGSCLGTLDRLDGHGMYLALGEGGTQLLAPVAPGLISRVAIREHRMLSIGESVTLSSDASTIALDGEREIEIYERQAITVQLTLKGPLVVDIRRCMEAAARSGVFCQPGPPPTAHPGPDDSLDRRE